jgi:protein CpxP
MIPQGHGQRRALAFFRGAGAQNPGKMRFCPCQRRQQTLSERERPREPGVEGSENAAKAEADAKKSHKMQNFVKHGGFSLCMKKPFIILTAALMGAIAPLAVFAADPPAPATPAATPPAGGPGRGQRMSPEERVKAMKDALGITDDQAAKIKDIFEKSAEKSKALRDDTTLSTDDRRTKMREIMTGATEDVNKILTPEQQTKWKEEMEKRRAARGNGAAPGN